jgi:hypothetical protein
MIVLKAFVIAIVASAAAMFGGAVVLGILNIYLAGHGIDWLNRNFEGGMTGMSPLSVALAVFVFSVFGGVFGVAVWVGRRRVS